MARIDLYPEINDMKMEIMEMLDIKTCNLNKQLLKRILEKYADFNIENKDKDKEFKKITSVITISQYKKGALEKINKLTGITVTQAYIAEIISLHKECKNERV